MSNIPAIFKQMQESKAWWWHMSNCLMEVVSRNLFTFLQHVHCVFSACKSLSQVSVSWGDIEWSCGGRESRLHSSSIFNLWRPFVENYTLPHLTRKIDAVT